MKVLLVVIDAATPRVVCPAIRTGRLPNLKRVADAGSMHQGTVTIFPSITPAATSSIITGAYPAEHGIAGAAWYDAVRKEVAYYGDDFWVIAKEGFGEFLRDFLVRLNGDRLTAPTLFELIERTGRSAACINYLVFRGSTRHRVNVPWLLAMLPGVPMTETVDGPQTLFLGDFVASDASVVHPQSDPGGPLHRFGMDDASSAARLRDLAARNALGDFTVAYFADNDYRGHEVGPHAGAAGDRPRRSRARGHVRRGRRFRTVHPRHVRRGDVGSRPLRGARRRRARRRPPRPGAGRLPAGGYRPRLAQRRRHHDLPEHAGRADLCEAAGRRDRRPHHARSPR